MQHSHTWLPDLLVMAYGLPLGASWRRAECAIAWKD